MDLTKFPPVIAIIAQEKLWDIKNEVELRRRLQKEGLLAELRRQAEWSISNYEYPKPSNTGFTVCPSGSLNPLSSIGKCGELKCRIQSADEFIKAVALYSDSIIIPDPSSSFLFDTNSPKISFTEFAVFGHLFPLIEAGALQFTSPLRSYCRDCTKMVKARVRLAVERVITEAMSTLEVAFPSRSRTVEVSSPIFYPDADHPVILSFRVTSKQLEIIRKTRKPHDRGGKLIQRLLIRALSEEVDELMFDLLTAQETKGVFLAASRLELLSLKDLTESRPNLNSIEQWEARRSIELPWINSLTATECVILRSEAPVALAKLRALLAERLQQPAELSSVSSIVAELRAQVSELESDVRRIKRLRGPAYRSTLRGLSVAFVLYGLISGAPAVGAASIAALLASMVHVHNDARTESEAAAKITSSPAFALMRAKQILKKRKK